jgi:hypothetical protein
MSRLKPPIYDVKTPKASFFASIITYMPDGTQIETYDTANVEDDITVEAAIAKETTTFISASTVPANAGETNTDLYLKF